MKQYFIQWFGWYGVVAILLAYAFVSFSILQPTGLAYQLLNVTGSLGIALEAWSRRDKQPVVLNIIWICIGVLVIWRLLI